MHRGKVDPGLSELPRGNKLSRDHVNRPSAFWKERLILDLSHLNNYIVKTSVKYEDLRTVIQLLKKGDYVFSFDIKSGYHHIDIFEEHRKYLSFCWKFEDGTIRYFHFNVLPFGLWPAPYVFTKVMRQLTKYWR